MDFGRQVGIENQAKIDPKRHRNSECFEVKKNQKTIKLYQRLTANGGVFKAGVGGGVNPSPREGGKGIGAV